MDIKYDFCTASFFMLPVNNSKLSLNDDSYDTSEDSQSVHTPTCSIEGIVVVLMVTVGEAAGARPYTRVCIQGFRQLCSLAVYRWQRFCFVADGWRQFLLFLQDTSSNDYAQQARLCSDLAYVYNSFAKVSCI